MQRPGMRGDRLSAICQMRRIQRYSIIYNLNLIHQQVCSPHHVGDKRKILDATD